MGKLLEIVQKRDDGPVNRHLEAGEGSPPEFVTIFTVSTENNVLRIGETHDNEYTAGHVGPSRVSKPANFAITPIDCNNLILHYCIL